jgi:plasmid replication initiation protein
MKIEGLTAISNKIVLSRSNFNVPERRILAAVIESLSPHLKEDITLKTTGKELSFEARIDDMSKITYRASDLSIPENYGEIRKALDSLGNRKIRIEYIEDNEPTYFGSNLISKFKFIGRSETIEIWADNELYRFLLDLSLGYTLYQTKVVLSFSSIYAMRMYEIIAKWRNKGQFYITIEELRWLTDTVDKFDRTNDFKRRVLDTAKIQMDESEITDLKFDYKEKKEGKTIVGFDFFIYKTDLAHDAPRKKLQPTSLRWDFGEELIANFERFGLNIKGKNLETVKALKLQIGEKKLSELMETLYEKAKTKKNASGYIISSLKNELIAESEEIDLINLSVEQRKKHAEKVRKEEPKSFKDILSEWKKKE